MKQSVLTWDTFLRTANRVDTEIIINETERILLENSRPGTGRLLAESDRVAMPTAYIDNENEKILFDYQISDSINVEVF